MSEAIKDWRSSEDDEQEVVIRWAQLSSKAWPVLELLHHIPNGGSRDKKEALKLKRMGVLPGVPDLHLPAARAGYNGLYIEMKYADGRLSHDQKIFLIRAAHFNNFCAVCYTAGDAIKLLENYINYKTLFKYDNLSILKNGQVIGTVQ